MSTHDASRRELSGLNHEIQSLIERVISLEERRDVVQQSLDAVIYPVLTLPTEIISQIFLHCLPTRPVGRPRTSEAPLVLLRVCKRWREIALVTHGLWQELELSTESFFSATAERHGLMQAITNQWFERAGPELPLSFTFGGYIPHVKSVIRSIVHHRAKRLRSLTLELPLENFPRLDPIDRDFCLLEKLSLGVMYSGTLFVNWFLERNLPYDCFSNSPRLREVHLRKPANPFLFVLPYQQLTKFTGEGLSADECLYLLRLAPSLVECKLEIDLDDPPTDIVTRAALPHLRSLSFTRSEASNDFEMTNVAVILNLLDTPVLERLELVHIPYLHRYARQMHAFLTQVSKSLRYFSFVGDNEEALLHPAVARWFKRLPNLTHVEFTRVNKCFTEEFFDMLAKKENYLTRLTTLRLLDYGYSFDDGMNLALFTRASPIPGRRGRVALQEFDLVWANRTFSHDLEPYSVTMDKCLWAGMQLYIGTAERNHLIELYPDATE